MRKMRPDTETEDIITPITLQAPTIRNGIQVYLRDEVLRFEFRDTSHRLPFPDAVKTTVEGGKNVKVEFYYLDTTLQKTLPLEKFDRSTFLLILGENPQTGFPKGKKFESLIGIGKLQDTLPQFPDVKLLKYVCLTANQTYIEKKPPLHLNGLGAPLDKSK